MTKTIRSIALCRVSTPEQALTGHSLERQNENVYRGADELGAPIKERWSLDQSSRAGKNFKRKDLNEMIAYCKANPDVKYLIVDEVDRFMRDIKYFYYFEAVFEQLGVKVWYASQPELNGDNMMAKLNKLFLIFRAEASNDERIGKTTNGLRERVRLGYYPFPTPQGYKRTITPGLFEPDDVRFNLLQKAFRKVLLGSNYKETTAWLTQQGYLTPQGKLLSPNRFREMLKCPYYAGVIRITGWDFTNEHPLHKKMVTLEEFDLIQERIDKKKYKIPHRNHNPEYKLSNLMECAECGGRLVGFPHRNGKGWVGHKYRCRGCKKKMYQRVDVHGALDDLLVHAHLVNENKGQFIADLKETWKEGRSEAFGHIQILEARRATLDEEKKKYLTALAMYPALKDDYLQQISDVVEKIKAVDEEMVTAKKVDDDLIEFTKFALDYVDGLKDNWWDLSFADMKKCKQLLFPSGFSINYLGKVYTPEISPLFRLEGYEKEPFRGSNLGMVEVAGVEPASIMGISGILHAQSVHIRTHTGQTSA